LAAFLSQASDNLSPEKDRRLPLIDNLPLPSLSLSLPPVTNPANVAAAISALACRRAQQLANAPIDYFAIASLSNNSWTGIHMANIRPRQTFVLNNIAFKPGICIAPLRFCAMETFVLINMAKSLIPNDLYIYVTFILNTTPLQMTVNQTVLTLGTR